MVRKTETVGVVPVKDTSPGRIDGVSNGAEGFIKGEESWAMEVTIVGTRPLLFHAWNCDAVKAKAEAKKGSKEKKTDDLESYVYRNEQGEICIPGQYLHACLMDMAKYHQDPRSPRKSAMEMVEEGLAILTESASLKKDKWDYEHRGRAVVQRNAITRTWPAFKAGWEATFQIESLLPEYITLPWLVKLISDAGRLKGMADYRPTYGRFQIKNYQLLAMRPAVEFGTNVIPI